MRARASVWSLLILAAVVGCKTEKKADESAAMAQDSAGAAITSAAPVASAVTPPPTPEPPRPAAIPAPADVAAAPKEAAKTATGLASLVLTKGTGKVHPKPEDRVRVHYTGWQKDGTMFDSSVARNEPAAFGVGQVIPGWQEALQLMVAGEKRRIWIPAKLAYGERAMPGMPSGDLTFDVELIEIIEAPKPPAVPTDLKTPPKTAKKTESGLSYRVLQEGKGKEHPKPTDRVTVHYSGWTTDGKMFDSSVMRGEPAVFPLNHVIPGWTEGVQLMHVGDKYRFWIPGKLAYGDTPSRPGAPAGTLVFDVELLAIQQ